MSKLDDLRNYVSQLFEAATDKGVIEKAAVVSSKIDEIASEQKKQEEDYNSLLKDYKEVVIHSSFKPVNNADEGAGIPAATQRSFDDLFDEAIKSASGKNKN